MQVRGPVVEGREGEGRVDGSDNPVPEPRSDGILFLPVAKGRLRKIDRAEAADDVFVDICRLVEKHIVIGPDRDVVGVIEQCNEIISRIVEGLDDAVI